GIDWYDALNRNAFHLPPLHEQPNGIILLPTNGVWHCPSAQRPGVWDQDPHWKNVLWVEYGYNESGLATHNNDTMSLGLGRLKGQTKNRLDYRPTPDKD